MLTLGWNEPSILDIQSATAAELLAASDSPLPTTITAMPTDLVFIVINTKGNELTEKVTTLQLIATGADITRTIRVQVTTQPHRPYLPVVAR